jgi:hypothetical protein
MYNLVIDGRDKEWTQSSTCYSNRLKNSILNIPNIEIIKRIGSPSTMAEVYHTKINNLDVACKLLPINSSASIKQIENEFIIASLVGKGDEIYFPYVYDKFYINDTYFYNQKCPFIQTDTSKDFNSSSKWYQYYDYLITNAPHEMIDTIILYKQKYIEPDITRDRLCPDIIIPTNIRSGVLLSEILEYDLSYYLNTNTLSQKEWIELLTHIFKAIEIMHTKYNILHNDLHLGNILINDKIPIIHDFGKSRISKFDNHYDKQHDVVYFLGQLLDREDIPTKIRDLLDPMPDIINNSNNQYPIIDIVKYITY